MNWARVTNWKYFHTADIRSALQALVLQYPGIVQSQNFQQIETNLTEVTTTWPAKFPLPIRQSLPALLMQLQKIIYNLADNLDALVGEFNLTGNNPFTSFPAQDLFLYR